MNYLGFEVEPSSDGAVYTCPKCEESYRYGLNACPDTLAAELSSHACLPPRPGLLIRRQAKGMVERWKAKRAGVITQESIDAREPDWYKRSETTNAKLARILQ